LTFGNPSSAGVPAAVAADTIVLPYNDVAALEALFATNGSEIAAIIVEPIAGNMNMILPSAEFVAAMRNLTTQHSAVLIYDEVMTGFRVGLHCTQGLHGITPDLTCLGKVVGGGMPLAAFGGRADIMAFLAPLGPVYQAGTLSGNPVAVAAGLATLAEISKPGFFESLSAQTAKFVAGLNEIGTDNGLCAQSVGGMFGVYFAEEVPTSFADVMASDRTRFNAFFHAMLDHGVYLAPSAFEAGFVSAAHSDADIAATLAAAKSALAQC
ncbi:MAG: aminotransferase class III-fold pyridoxal phosphate-dependent enzyme, partial [Deefgea sp.]